MQCFLTGFLKFQESLHIGSIKPGDNGRHSRQRALPGVQQQDPLDQPDALDQRCQLEGRQRPAQLCPCRRRLEAMEGILETLQNSSLKF